MRATIDRCEATRGDPERAASASATDAPRCLLRAAAAATRLQPPSLTVAFSSSVWRRVRMRLDSRAQRRGAGWLQRRARRRLLLVSHPTAATRWQLQRMRQRGQWQQRRDLLCSCAWLRQQGRVQRLRRCCVQAQGVIRQSPSCAASLSAVRSGAGAERRMERELRAMSEGGQKVRDEQGRGDRERRARETSSSAADLLSFSFPCGLLCTTAPPSQWLFGETTMLLTASMERARKRPNARRPSRHAMGASCCARPAGPVALFASFCTAPLLRFPPSLVCLSLCCAVTLPAPSSAGRAAERHSAATTTPRADQPIPPSDTRTTRQTTRDSTAPHRQSNKHAAQAQSTAALQSERTAG